MNTWASKNSFLIVFFLFAVFLTGCASLPGAKFEPIEGRQVEYSLVRNNGPDTVIFENGLGSKMNVWEKVLPDIAKDATVFAYNRPGYGKSDEVSTPRTGMQVMDELRKILLSQGLKPPYILVGHSIGGLYMQFFARRYPGEVKALILVDSTPVLHDNGRNLKESWPFWLKFGFWLWASGVNEKEFNEIAKTGEAILALPPMTGKPVIVLSAAKPLKSHPDQPDVNAVDEERKSVASLYPGSKQVWVVSGHGIQQEKPEIVISAIREVLSNRK